MSDDTIGCDCDWDEGVEAFWEEVVHNGGLEGEPMSEEYYNQAIAEERM